MQATGRVPEKMTFTPKRLQLGPLCNRWQKAEPAALERALGEARSRDTFIDLISRPPQESGFLFPAELLATAIEQALQSPGVVGYRPDARGQSGARSAIAAYYSGRGTVADPGRLVLTPGTSLGYLTAFRLLCQRGDEILIPRPGYPLFDDLAAIAGVGLRAYHLGQRDDTWHFDPEELRFQITPRTRAVVVVSPHNPTGHCFSREELESLAGLCREYGLALIFDEVFCEFLSEGSESAFPRPDPAQFPLVITLNGLSKMLSLPQWKIAWMKVDGDHHLVSSFLAAAEHFSDSLLAVNELAQAITPAVLEAGERGMFREFRVLLGSRRDLLRQGMPLPLASHDAGAYVCARLPDGADDVAVALHLLEADGLYLHPGSFYDMPGHLIMTATAGEEQLCAALSILRRFQEQRLP